jgi:hypothetical protein
MPARLHLHLLLLLLGMLLVACWGIKEAPTSTTATQPLLLLHVQAGRHGCGHDTPTSPRNQGPLHATP